MSQLVECVLNVSEGRDSATISAIAGSIEAVSGVHLLDVSSDPDHHRSVYTFAGDPLACPEAAFRVVETAVKRIDLRHHAGVHPRLGAVDVVPFVPLRGVSMARCVDCAHALGEKVASTFEIPVFFYESAALLPERRLLANVRRGGFEALSESIATDPLRAPDRGPRKVHPTAGAIIIGARPLLVAFNVYLRAREVTVARRIASLIRERNGGLSGLRALGFYIPARDRCQVSMNLTDIARVTPRMAFDAVAERALASGTSPTSSELIGLIPAAALAEGDVAHMKLERFSPDRILETRLKTATGA